MAATRLILMQDRAFTLIELLVVITIIVVLLALLTPALDKATYQAELAVCGAHEHGIGSGVLIYAFENNRRYPFRPTTFKSRGKPSLIRTPFSIELPQDDRPIFSGHVSLKFLLCPMTSRVDLERNQLDVEVYSPYDLWFGFQYLGGSTQEEGMLRVGNHLTWDGQGFDFLASDIDSMARADRFVYGTHPDDEGVMVDMAIENSQDPAAALFDGVGASFRYTHSRWQSTVTDRRGRIDANYLFQDGSVKRYAMISWNDDRIVNIPEFSSATNYPNYSAWVPKEGAR